MLSERLSVKLTVGGGTERGSPASRHYSLLPDKRCAVAEEKYQTVSGYG